MEIILGIGLLVVIGLVLIGVEFYMPGFVLATVGIILMLTADFICLTHFGSNWAAGLFLAEVALSVLTGYVVIKTIPQTAAGKRMILSHEQKNVSAASQAPELVGAEGVAQTTLRPSGMAEIVGKRLDVVAESDMIARGSTIKVIAVEGSRIVVRKV
ncbi:MAG: NfeD family protein [Verrucomicrobiota bacterium]